MLASTLTPMSGYSTGDLEFTVSSLPSWSLTGLVEPEFGWLLCNGAITPSTGRYAALNQMLGTAFGVAGQLPALISGVQPVAAGPSVLTRGASGGVVTVALTLPQLAGHIHTWQDAYTNWNGGAPSPSNTMGDPTQTEGTFWPQTSGTTGAGQAHNNMPPYLAVDGIMVKL